MNLLRHNITKQEYAQNMALAAGTIKLLCGVANNAAWLVMLDAHDKIKQHPAYRQAVKQRYKQALEQIRSQEKKLLYATHNRMFHLADFPEEIRKKYGNISDAEYFEYYQGLGAKVYAESKPWLGSLHNKYRLSLLHHDIPYADLLAWPMVAQACIEIACKMYRLTIQSCIKTNKLPECVLNDTFRLFNLRNVSQCWHQAIKLTDPKALAYKSDPDEERNIALGIEQLEEVWGNPRMIYGSVLTATQDFEEIFRTKGVAKKLQRIIQEEINDLG